MINNIIKDMKKKRMLSNVEYNMVELLDTLREHLKNNIDILQKGFEYEYNTKLDVERLLNCFEYMENNYGIIESSFKNEYGKVANNYVPYGVVGVVVKNNINLYQYATILSMLIQTHNSIIIKTYKDVGTIHILIEMINQVITQIKGINSIIISDEELENNNLDLLIYIGKKEDYYKLNVICDKKYYGIGRYELIVDKVIDNKMLEEARKRNITIIDRDTNDEVYNEFNFMSSNYCVSIMTDSKEVARNFIANVKASNVLVNALPTLQEEVNIDINELLYKKSTLIWEDYR